MEAWLSGRVTKKKKRSLNGVGFIINKARIMLFYIQLLMLELSDCANNFKNSNIIKVCDPTTTTFTGEEINKF